MKETNRKVEETVEKKRGEGAGREKKGERKRRGRESWQRRGCWRRERRGCWRREG